jgi:phospholipid/cholesterol/gamma-HCH transport system ATP-binding protein
MIEIKNIKKSFDGSKILQNISTTFEKGKTNLIIGQSGSGKTVLLKCLLGLHQPDSGEIIYDGTSNLNMNESDKTLLRREMGMVFQGSALFDSMSVLENVMFPLNMLTKKNEEEIREKAKSVIERVELNNAIDKLPSEISGGMQKRVAIARAIVMNPKYLFCDEPNSGLDPKTAIVIDNLIQEITREYDITTVINTHDMNSVLEIGENIVFLKKGNLVWQGNKDEIFKTENDDVTDFVYSSDLFKKVREAQLKGL